MADYTKLQPNVRTPIPAGTHTIGKGEYLIEIGAASGGKGGDCSANATNNPWGGSGPYLWGGPGGVGGSCKFKYQFDTTASFSISYGNSGGSGMTTYAPDNQTGASWGISGGKGADTTLFVNGVLIAKCTGGGGGQAGYFTKMTALPEYPPEVIRTWTGYDGAPGTPGRVEIAPSGYQPGGAYGMYITKLNAPPLAPKTITYGTPLALADHLS